MRLRLAPVNVLADHLAMAIVKVKPTGLDALHAIGVRLASAPQLLALVDTWRQEHDEAAQASQPSQPSQGAQAGASQPGASPTGAAEDGPLPLPSGLFTPRAAWRFAKPPPMAGKKPAAWEESSNRLQRGESPEAIALSQPSGKPINTATVIGHALTGLTQGRPVDLLRLASFSQGALPTRREWAQLRDAELATGIDCVEDEKAIMTSLVADFLPSAAKPPEARTPEDKAALAPWYEKCKWFFALRRAGYDPGDAAHSAKRPRA